MTHTFSIPLINNCIDARDDRDAESLASPEEEVLRPTVSEPALNVDTHEEFGTTTWHELETFFKPGLVAHIRAHVANLKLPKVGLTYVRAALESPSRRVRSTTKSSSGIFQSTKTGGSIGFESRTLELPFAITAEHDERVIAFLDQAPTLKVRYVRNGRTRSYHQTPDFLVVRDDSVVLVECKPAEKLLERNLRDPDFYVQDGSVWGCPALQQAARELGMQHEIWTANRFTPNRLRNLRLLGDYLASSAQGVPGYDQALRAMQQFLDEHVRTTVRALLDALKESVCVDHLTRRWRTWTSPLISTPRRCPTSITATFFGTWRRAKPTPRSNGAKLLRTTA